MLRIGLTLRTESERRRVWRILPVYLPAFRAGEVMDGFYPQTGEQTRFILFHSAASLDREGQINVAGEVLNISPSFFAISLLIARWPVS
jgi:hypothetical protein